MKIRQINNNVLEICNEKNQLILSIAEELLSNGVMSIVLEGEITNEVAHEFEDEVMAALSVCKNLELNFEKVTYIASIALKSLLSVQQMIDDIDESSMILKSISPEVMGILKETGFSDILQIEVD